MSHNTLRLAREVITVVQMLQSLYFEDNSVRHDMAHILMCNVMHIAFLGHVKGECYHVGYEQYATK